MGWDGYAYPRPKGDDLFMFKASAELIKEMDGSVDWLLERGALDCSNCAAWMETLTGYSAYENWSREQMAERYASAATSPELYAECTDEWARSSALEFMRLCVFQGRSMRVSY